MTKSISILVALSVLLAFGCSGSAEPHEPDPEPAPEPKPEPTKTYGVCEPRDTCDAEGFAWVLLAKTEQGDCDLYTYACASATSKLCESRWETVCPPGAP